MTHFGVQFCHSPSPITSTISLGIITTGELSTSIIHGDINEMNMPCRIHGNAATRGATCFLWHVASGLRTVAKLKSYLDVPQGTVQDTKVGRLFLILGDRQLPLQEFEAFLQMRSAVFFKLVVDLARASPKARQYYYT